MEKLLRFIRPLIPRALFAALQPLYHFTLAGIGALWYGLPSRKLFVVGVTGTKGKTSVTELVAAILEEAGFRVALVNSNRIKIAGASRPNLTTHSMPGRTKLQKFFREAVSADCTYAVVEMTSEGAKQFRHAFIALDALIFTNLSPEHIESHGSYEKYVNAKLSLARALERGNWKEHIIIANKDDAESIKFLATRAGIKKTFSLENVRPYTSSKEGGTMTWHGTMVTLNIPGEFNVANAVAAATFAESRGVSDEIIKSALEKFTRIAGRMERIDEGQDFTVVVDYAHTADSLDRALSVYKGSPIIGILGGTGGGRDVGKRKVMGEIADRHCTHIILTTEDPYDESPEAIANDVAQGITNHPHEFILDRREAMRKAFLLAKKGWVVFVGGKGAMSYIMGPKGSKTPWSDAAVAREELKRLIQSA